MSAVVHVDVARPDVDVAIDLLWVSGALGVHTDDLDPATVRLVTAFDGDTDPEAVAQVLRVRLPAAAVEVRDDDGTWWDSWRAHARPVVAAGGRLVVLPAWWDGPVPVPEADAPVEVRIDPGRTFGSGAHATTRLVLDALASLPLHGARVLDVGCGSGVLSVVAVRLGASSALAVDIDPACAHVTRENAERNEVSDRVSAVTTPLADLVGEFEVVAANVLLPVLETVAADVDRLGTRSLVVSGLLAGTEGRVTEAFAGWQLVARTEAEGWVCLLLSRGRTLAEPNEDLPERSGAFAAPHVTVGSAGGAATDR